MSRPTFGQLAGRLLQQQRTRAGFGGGSPAGGAGGAGGAPNLGSVFGGSAGIFLLIAGGYAVNSALFNGKLKWMVGLERGRDGKSADSFWIGVQLMEDIVRSSTRGFMVFQRKFTQRELIFWFETPITFDIRTKPTVIPSLTGTKDLQMVDIQVRVLHRPSVAHLPTIYRELGTDYAERVLPSIVNEVLKSVVAQFNAS
ncbi:hypothetical protein P7C70_g8904, partial [Phenoliferia sp. Uapishka_3]